MFMVYSCFLLSTAFVAASPQVFTRKSDSCETNLSLPAFCMKYGPSTTEYCANSIIKGVNAASTCEPGEEFDLKVEQCSDWDKLGTSLAETIQKHETGLQKRNLAFLIGVGAIFAPFVVVGGVHACRAIASKINRKASNNYPVAKPASSSRVATGYQPFSSAGTSAHRFTGSGTGASRLSQPSSKKLFGSSKEDCVYSDFYSNCYSSTAAEAEPQTNTVCSYGTGTGISCGVDTSSASAQPAADTSSAFATYSGDD
jgi:hypothetical protein